MTTRWPDANLKNYFGLIPTPPPRAQGHRVVFLSDKGGLEELRIHFAALAAMRWFERPVIPADIILAQIR
jgi:hypothetical protein